MEREYGRARFAPNCAQASLGTPSVEEPFRAIHSIGQRPPNLPNPAESLLAGSEASKALTSSLIRKETKYLAEHVSVPQGKFSIRDWMDTGTAVCLSDYDGGLKPLVFRWVDVFLSGGAARRSSKTVVDFTWMKSQVGKLPPSIHPRRFDQGPVSGLEWWFVCKSQLRTSTWCRYV